mgnify:CR=1 FL=1
MDKDDVEEEDNLTVLMMTMINGTKMHMTNKPLSYVATCHSPQFFLLVYVPQFHFIPGGTDG